MKRKILFLILFFFFLHRAESYATTINYLPQGSTPAQEGYSGPVNESNCSSIAKPSAICSNGSPVGTTTCSGETPCTGGNTWSKYSLLGCYADNNRIGQYAWLYDYSTLVCSTGDKYNSSNPPVLNAGFCSCQPGGPYKTCCSNGAAVSANSFDVDPYPPPEGGCGNNTVVFCGGAGQPPCGAAACALPPTPPPTPTGTKLSCSNPDCGTGYTSIKLTNGNFVCSNNSTGNIDPTVTPKCYSCSGTGGSCASDPTGKLNTSTCDNTCKACPKGGGWTGEACTTPNATRSKTCASDPNTCNKCSLGYCLEAKKNPSLYCWFDNPTCVTDPNKCAGFGTCGTGATGCTDEQGAKYPIGSVRTRCGAQNACTIPQ